MFGFWKDTTLVSYILKRNKSVVLLSIMHDSVFVDKDTQKPNVILDYNMIKGSADIVNQTCGCHSVA
jgi:hypothetical protein